MIRRFQGDRSFFDRHRLIFGYVYAPAFPVRQHPDPPFSTDAKDEEDRDNQCIDPNISTGYVQKDRYKTMDPAHQRPGQAKTSAR
jgi:hypothetical protein